MRLLIINPNTSSGVTERIRAAANAAAMPGDHFTTTSAAFGPELIVTEEDACRAVEGVKATVSRHSVACDGIVLASFGDTGAEEVRRLRPGLPVIGIASAAFATARVLGGRFGIVTFGESVAPPLRRKAEEMSLKDALIDIACVAGGDMGDPGTVQSRLHPALEAECLKMIERGANSVGLGGGPLAGLARKFSRSMPVPVIDGTHAAIGLMRAVVDQREGTNGLHDAERIG